MSHHRKLRLAVVVSHPIQYHVPLYRRLAQRADLELKVFFTWHDGRQAVLDQGFNRAFKWDIPLTEGYEFELVPNTARQPGTDHFGGLRNPALVARVMSWRPDAVHLSGYAYVSHLTALRTFARRGVPVMFRGDSHLLASKGGWRWLLKSALLRAVYRWPAAFLYVGQANRSYYRTFGVPEHKLFYCPHCIDVGRFAEPHVQLEAEAAHWRAELGLSEQQCVVLFAGKFESVKQPLDLVAAFSQIEDSNLVLVLVGNGELEPQIRARVLAQPEKFRLLPFQNQSRMPLVYRLGDLLVLPSRSETWGLAVNEAFACSRPALISDQVGCAFDLVAPGVTGEVFPTGDWLAFRQSIAKLAGNREKLLEMGKNARSKANYFDLAEAESHLMEAIDRVKQQW